MTPSKEKQLLFILAAVQFCHIIDFMIIMPLGKTLMRDLDISAQQFSLIVTIYAFMAFVAGLVSTAFIDRFDRKVALIFLFTGFTLGTLACAFTPSYSTLLIFRGVTGAFGGTLGALVLAIVGDVIPLKRRASAMGWVMTAFSAASVVGVPAGIYIAAEAGWRMPFIVVAILSGVILLLVPKLVPSLRGHLSMATLAGADRRSSSELPSVIVAGSSELKSEKTPLSRDELRQSGAPVAGPTASTPADTVRPPSAFAPFRTIFGDPNQRAALLFTVVLMLGHFSIIPFIAPYMQLNVGFEDKEVSLIYLIGGLLTVVLLPLFGKLADRYGRMLIFSLASGLALFSIFALTNLPSVPIWIALIVTSSFFVVASGRSVPATTMITSVVQPENRGSFMSIRQSFNEAALALSSFVAGFIIVEDTDGSLLHYDWVGYFAIFMSVVAIFVARRLKAVA
ncbi:MFS transporter [Lewinellaceae bacterium SD302]|nr:MFS transporter [Lewinellaceae bacterium SD302]